MALAVFTSEHSCAISDGFSIAYTRQGGFLMGAVGSMAWGRSGPGTLADASCQDRPETTGREDCAAGGPGLRPVPLPIPCPSGMVVTDHSPAPSPLLVLQALGVLSSNPDHFVPQLVLWSQISAL